MFTLCYILKVGVLAKERETFKLNLKRKGNKMERASNNKQADTVTLTAQITL